MEFQEVIEERNRMCKAHEKECIRTLCPMSMIKEFNGCVNTLMNHPKEFEEVVKKWSSEHPGLHMEEKQAKTYGQGLEDAWQFARDIWSKYVGSQVEEIFGTMEADEVMEKYTAKEAMQKLQEWKDKQINVGDIICHAEDHDVLVVVTDIDYSGSIYGIDKKGRVYSNKNPKDFEKTGRNISDQLNALLKKVNGE